jgi:transposase-like protein
MSDTELLLKSELPRRRSWTAEQKAQIVAECDEAGAPISAVARRHGLTPQQLFGWRRAARRQAEEASGKGAAFARVIVESGAPISPVGRKSRPIEVVIGAPSPSTFRRPTTGCPVFLYVEVWRAVTRSSVQFWTPFRIQPAPAGGYGLWLGAIGAQCGPRRSTS